MRQSYVHEGVNEAAVVAQARTRTETTFVHLHPYEAECVKEQGCYIVNPGVWDARDN